MDEEKVAVEIIHKRVSFRCNKRHVIRDNLIYLIDKNQKGFHSEQIMREKSLH